MIMAIQTQSDYGNTSPNASLTGTALRWLVGFIAVSALVGIYLLLDPIDLSASNLPLIPVAVLLIASYWILFSVAILRQRRAKYPFVEGVILLVVLLTLLLLGFAYLYQSMSANDPNAFTTNIETKLAALYFSVTTLSTVGYGEISPGNDTARAVTMVQMLLDLTVLGLGVKLLTQASKDRLQILTAKPDGTSLATD